MENSRVTSPDSWLLVTPPHLLRWHPIWIQSLKPIQFLQHLQGCSPICACTNISMSKIYLVKFFFPPLTHFSEKIHNIKSIFFFLTTHSTENFHNIKWVIIKVTPLGSIIIVDDLNNNFHLVHSLLLSLPMSWVVQKKHFSIKFLLWV